MRYVVLMKNSGGKLKELLKDVDNESQKKGNVCKDYLVRKQNAGDRTNVQLNV